MEINSPISSKNQKSMRLVLAVFVFSIIGVTALLSSRASAQTNPAWATLGIYGTSGTKTVAKHEDFEKWLGRNVAFSDLNIGYRDRNGIKPYGEASSNTWNFFLRKPTADEPNWTSRPDVTLAVTTPLISSSRGQTAEFRRTFFNDVANGKYDSHYKKFAQRFLDGGHGDDIIRLGHEPELKYPWSYKDGLHKEYEKAWLHVRGVMKSIAPDLRFDYQGNGNFHRKNPATGTTYAESVPKVLEAADIIGVDVYDRREWPKVLVKLEYTRDLAIKYGVQMSIPEWGLDPINGDNPEYIQNMYDFINSLPKNGPGSIAYHSYFNGHPPSNLNQYPKAQALFKSLFGNDIDKTPPTVPTGITIR